MEQTISHLEVRLQRLQQALRRRSIDIAVISNPTTFCYLTGHKPLLSVSPTTPWFLVVSTRYPPVACVPSIGVDDFVSICKETAVRFWPSPFAHDEGRTILAELLDDQANAGDTVGLELGREMRLTASLADIDELRLKRPLLRFVDVADAIWETRQIKDVYEIAAMRKAISAAKHAFKEIGTRVRAGMTEREAATNFKIFALEGGAQDIGYLACGSGEGGYASLTRAPTDRTSCDGDVIGIDTGLKFDEVWCDFNRNYFLGGGKDDARDAQETLKAAMAHASKLLKPGVRTSTLRLAMQEVVEQSGFSASPAGRWGHGVGLDFTEPPSLSTTDDTVVEEGMVLTMEL